MLLRRSDFSRHGRLYCAILKVRICYAPRLQFRVWCVRESGRKADCSDSRAVERFDGWVFGFFLSVACCAWAEPMRPHGPDDAIHSLAACSAVNAAEPSCRWRVVSQRRCSGFLLETPCAPEVRLFVRFFSPARGPSPKSLRRLLSVETPDPRSVASAASRAGFFFGFVPLRTSPGSTPPIHFYSPHQHALPI